MKTKPFSKTKSIVTYVVCGVLIVALAIGNYYASLYKDLITVYTSGSDVVTTDESAKVCQTIEEEGMVLLKNEDGLPLKEGAKVSLLGQDSKTIMMQLSFVSDAVAARVQISQPSYWQAATNTWNWIRMKGTC